MLASIRTSNLLFHYKNCTKVSLLFVLKTHKDSFPSETLNFSMSGNRLEIWKTLSGVRRSLFLHFTLLVVNEKRPQGSLWFMNTALLTISELWAQLRVIYPQEGSILEYYYREKKLNHPGVIMNQNYWNWKHDRSLEMKAIDIHSSFFSSISGIGKTFCFVFFFSVVLHLSSV